MDKRNYMIRLKVLEAKLKKAVIAANKAGDSSFEAYAEFEIRPGLGIKVAAYMLDPEDEFVTFTGKPVSYEDESLTEFWDEDCCSLSELSELVIDIFDQFHLTQIYGNAKVLVTRPVLVKETDGLLEESRKVVRSRIKEDQITRKQKEKLNLLNDIVNFAYEYGENETKTLFKQAFKRVTGDDLVDSLSDDSNNSN